MQLIPHGFIVQPIKTLYLPISLMIARQFVWRNIPILQRQF